MVSNDVVLQTVRKMMASGVDESTIRMTLKGINLSDEEAGEVLEEARGAAAPNPKGQKARPTATPQDEEEAGIDEEGNEEDFEGEEGTGTELEGEAVDELHGHIDSSSQEQLAHHAETHQMLEQHSAKIESVAENVGALHEKIDSMPRLPSEAVATLSALDRRISSLEKAVNEAGANTAALRALMQRIIDNERQILLELQKGK